MKFQLNYLKILKDDVVKVLHLICQQTWKTQQWPQDQKRLLFTPISKKGNAKQCSNYCTISLFSHANKVIIKPSSKVLAVCELRPSRCTSWVSKRQRSQRSNCQHSLDHGESKEIPEKHLLLLH